MTVAVPTDVALRKSPPFAALAQTTFAAASRLAFLGCEHRKQSSLQNRFKSFKLLQHGRRSSAKMPLPV